uniref:Dynein light chain n=1 Tax=Bubo bubo TaxID=30461 RepID=A0A8C0IAN6_BUBBB
TCLKRCSKSLECAILAIDKYNVEREMTALTEREFEQKCSPTRHCIVGRKSVGYVSHEIMYFIFFLMHGVNILFKAG